MSGESPSPSPSPSPSLSDADLLHAVRAGDATAYHELHERHVAAARSLARQLVRGEAEVEDVVAESFTKILDLVGRGGGPQAGFRTYLLTVVRRTVHDRTRVANCPVPAGETFDPDVPFVDPALIGLEQSLIAKAFLSLPERWRAVLWHTEVEHSPLADVAVLLGLPANGVTELTRRALAGLRQAYLRIRLTAPTRHACRPVLFTMSRYVRGGLARRASKAVDEHVKDCPECRAVLLELTDVNRGLRVIIGPMIAGPVFAGYATALAKTRTASCGSDGLGWILRLPLGWVWRVLGGIGRGPKYVVGGIGWASRGVVAWVGRVFGNVAGWVGRVSERLVGRVGRVLLGWVCVRGEGGQVPRRVLGWVRRVPTYAQAAIASGTAAAVAAAAMFALITAEDPVRRPVAKPVASAGPPPVRPLEDPTRPAPERPAAPPGQRPHGPRLHATIGALGALVRDRPGIIAIRLRNSGNAPTREIEAAVDLPTGVTLIPSGHHARGAAAGVALRRPGGYGGGVALERSRGYGMGMAAGVVPSAIYGRGAAAAAMPSATYGRRAAVGVALERLGGHGGDVTAGVMSSAVHGGGVAAGVALGRLGGHGRDVAAGAVPPGGYGRGVAVVTPVGTRGGWSCRPARQGATCVRGPLKAARKTAVFLRVQVAAQAPQGAGPAVRITSGSLRAAAHSAAGVRQVGASARFAADGKVTVRAIGNSMLSCPAGRDGCAEVGQRQGERQGDRWDGGLWPMDAVDEDGVAGTYASSGATLRRPPGGRVVWAGLYWSAGGESAGPISLRPPGRRRYLSIRPEQVTVSELPSGFAYQAFADVTGLVGSARRDGMWWAADLPMREGAARHAGWSLVMIVTDPAGPYSHAVVLDTATVVGGEADQVRIPLGGLVSAGSAARMPRGGLVPTSSPTGGPVPAGSPARVPRGSPFAMASPVRVPRGGPFPTGSPAGGPVLRASAAQIPQGGPVPAGSGAHIPQGGPVSAGSGARIPQGRAVRKSSPARIEMVTWEGDADLGGDRLSLGSGALTPAGGDRDAGNVFDSSSNGAKGMTFGVDVDTFGAELGNDPALAIATREDVVLFAIAAVCVRARS
ncbi:sigma factor [Nonomuraea guangzhouensis]|uniref:Sigma factor n=1 Tax=Nonomuraea guangzhouensis TaxID=1291555 RepID=A0ABW4GHC9_9ACTN|nr:sigma-70 family RNA polymerase sigma factor [Nonomuraea guangzhouensis]